MNPQQTTHYSFYLTFVLLATTGTITFIEAIRTEDPYVRHVMNLETVISVIAGFFYYSFIQKIDGKDWSEINLLRYLDWSVTTPFMLLSLVMFLAYNIHAKIYFSHMLLIWAMNYAMLYTGYLGEIGNLSRSVACFLGFIPFVAMQYTIYKNYVAPKYDKANWVMFLVYTFLWSLYGIVYLFPVHYKNIFMNILDLCSKCLVGIGMWLFYIHVLN